LIISFWGKGGVGKTTCAAASAVYFAKRGFKTLIVTTDFMPSLSDILGLKLTAKPTPVIDGKLYALELREDEVYTVISSFLPVGREIIDYIAGAPGISEEFMLYYMLEVWRSREFDVIVWDTPASGEALSLLHLEDKFYRHLGEAVKLYLKVKGFLKKVREGGKGPLELINEWRGLVDRIFKMLSSSVFTAYIVTIPEALSVAQTERLIGVLEGFNINVEGIIVNQLIDRKLYGVCRELDGKIKVHSKHLDYILKRFSGRYKVAVIPLVSWEIRGVERLEEFSRFLSEILNSKLRN